MCARRKKGREEKTERGGRDEFRMPVCLCGKIEDYIWGLLVCVCVCVFVRMFLCVHEVLIRGR